MLGSGSVTRRVTGTELFFPHAEQRAVRGKGNRTKSIMQKVGHPVAESGITVRSPAILAIDFAWRVTSAMWNDSLV